MEKELGVWMDDSLEFSDHVLVAAKKANQILGMIKLSFNYLDMSTVKLLCVCMIRPHLEYGNVVWHPRFKKDMMNLIENVQHRATRMIPGFRNLSYEERLRRLDLPTLSSFQRRCHWNLQVPEWSVHVEQCISSASSGRYSIWCNNSWSPKKTEEAKLPYMSTLQYIRLQDCQSVEFTAGTSGRGSDTEHFQESFWQCLQTFTFLNRWTRLSIVVFQINLQAS